MAVVAGPNKGDMSFALSDTLHGSTVNELIEKIKSFRGVVSANFTFEGNRLLVQSNHGNLSAKKSTNAIIALEDKIRAAIENTMEFDLHGTLSATTVAGIASALYQLNDVTEVKVSSDQRRLVVVCDIGDKFQGTRRENALFRVRNEINDVISAAYQLLNA
jgi:predicted proteasome-type protease